VAFSYIELLEMLAACCEGLDDLHGRPATVERDADLEAMEEIRLELYDALANAGPSLPN
jgi:hypothetical protein